MGKGVQAVFEETTPNVEMVYSAFKNMLAHSNELVIHEYYYNFKVLLSLFQQNSKVQCNGKIWEASFGSVSY